MAYFTEVPPATASRIFESTHQWTDDEWMTARASSDRPDEQPMSVYEVHLGSWKRHPGAGPYSYDELAEHLTAYVVETGLHPRRVPPGDGAPVRRLVGLPGHVLLRPDRRASVTPTASVASSTRCTTPASA